MLPKESRIKELLRQRGLDGAIVSSPENFHYVTGFAGHQYTVSRQLGFSVAVVSARENVPTQLATMDFEVPTFELKSAGRFIVRKYDRSFALFQSTFFTKNQGFSLGKTAFAIADVSLLQ